MKRPALFLAVTVLFAASTLYSRALRRVYLPSDLQYLPKENELVVMTGRVDELWRAVEHHFGEAIRDAEQAGRLARFVSELAEDLDERGVAVSSLADLEAHGIDVGRSVYFSANALRDEDTITGLLVLPATRGDALTRFFAQLGGEEPRQVPSLLDRSSRAAELDETVPSRYPVLSFDDDVLLAYPEPGMAILTDDVTQLRRSIWNSPANLTHTRQDDGFYALVREQSGQPVGTGPLLLGFWRPLGVPGVEGLVATLSLGEEEIRSRVDVRVEHGGLRIIDDLVATSRQTLRWERFLPLDTAAVIVVDDSAIPRYLTFLKRFSTLRERIETSYAGVFDELRGIDGLQQLMLAVTGYRDGLPEALLGVRGDTVGLAGAVRNLQLRHRERRDRAILEAAVDAYSPGADNGQSDDPTLSDLLAAGLLVAENDSLFATDAAVSSSTARSLLEGSALREALESSGLVDAPAYLGEYDGHTLRHVLPPISENDLRYMPGLEREHEDILLSDRYRIATFVRDDILWVAADALELAALLDRPSRESSSLADAANFRRMSAEWTGEEKILVYLDIDHISTLGLLNPDSEISDSVKTALFDFRNHPAIALTVTGDSRTSGLTVAVRVAHRKRSETR